MTHTPGPWTWQRGDRDRLEQTLVGGDEDGTFVLRIDRHSLSHILLNQADAALIAAAPELLAECERLVGLVKELAANGFFSLADSDIAPTRRAIAKARGQAVPS